MRTHAFPVWFGVGLLLLAGAANTAAFAGAKVAVLDFELNDLTLDPGRPEEMERTAALKPLLEQALAAKGHYRLIPVGAEPQQEANQGFGYLFDHPDAAAELARESGADWVVVGRVHKASFLFVYVKARLIDAATGRLAGDFVVEVKGPQREPAIQRTLTSKGAETLAEQIDEVLRLGSARRQENSTDQSIPQVASRVA